MPNTSIQLQPSHIAFFDECRSSISRPSADTSSIAVHALCWARTPNAWAALAQSWASMKAYRDEQITNFKHPKGHSITSSWVFAAAPMLGAPFRDNPAEESTLAAWISRAQMSIAVAVHPEQKAVTRNSAGQQVQASVLECMSGYADFLKSPGSTPCRMVLAAARPADIRELLASAFKSAHERQPDWFPRKPMQLQFCGPDEYPLPLALTTLVSAAVLRYVNNPTEGNPIFHAVRPRLIRVPPAIGSPRPSGHRRMRLS